MEGQIAGISIHFYYPFNDISDYQDVLLDEITSYCVGHMYSCENMRITNTEFHFSIRYETINDLDGKIKSVNKLINNFKTRIK